MDQIGKVKGVRLRLEEGHCANVRAIKKMEGVSFMAGIVVVLKPKMVLIG